MARDRWSCDHDAQLKGTNMSQLIEADRSPTSMRKRLPLSALEWVEVRSAQEILATLDEHGRLDGMPFMPEMLRYCGQRLQVSKRAHKTCDTITRTGIRHLDASVHLGDTRCDGSAHGGCDAACLLFWKEAWIKRLDGADAAATPARATVKRGCTEQQLRAATQVPTPSHAGEPIYACQATQLLEATSTNRKWDLRHFVEDYTSGNVDVATMVRGAAYRVSSVIILRTERLARRFGLRRALSEPLISLYDAFQARLPRGVPFPRRPGAIPKGQRTPTEPPKNLRPGEWVRVKSYEQIRTTLDPNNKNRGLYFDAEHVPYCGKIGRVRSVVKQIIDERTGKMLRFKTPCVILEGASCKAAYSEHRFYCPRAIYPYWRELWLDRLDAPAPLATPDTVTRQPSQSVRA